MTGGGWDVFIAYGSRDRPSAEELHAHLVEGGAKPFLDHKDVPPGDVWPATIPAAQRSARLTAVLVSAGTDAFYRSEEVALAIELSRADPVAHRVVPVYLDEEADPPYGLRIVQALRAPEVGGMVGVAGALVALLGIDRYGDGGRHVPAVVLAPPSPPRRSPFRPGMPLYASDWLPGPSRRALRDRLRADLGAGANVNLVGERRLGRTSMLNHVHGRLLADARQVVARVNLQDGIGSDRGFYGAVLWAIWRSALGTQAVEPSLGRALEPEPEAGYAELRRALLKVREHATAILLVDEFERCFDPSGDFPFPAFFDNLRSLLGGDGQGPYARAVVATRQPLTSYFTSRQVTSTLPTYLPIRRLEPLTDDDVEEALAQEGPHRLGALQRGLAAELAGRHPCRLQSAGEAWYRALEGGHGEEWARAEFEELSKQTCSGAVPVAS